MYIIMLYRVADLRALQLYVQYCVILRINISLIACLEREINKLDRSVKRTKSRRKNRKNRDAKEIIPRLILTGI
jgi:hypothetical protein